MSTNKTTTWITSPVGEIAFLAVANKVPRYPKKKKPDGPMVFTGKLIIDGTTKEGAEWKKTLEEVNDSLVITKSTEFVKLKPGEYAFQASSQFDVAVLGTDGQRLETLPYFFAGEDTGRAQLVIQPHYAEQGGSLNLMAVIIHELTTNPDRVATGGAEAREAEYEALVETLRKNKK